MTAAGVVPTAKHYPGLGAATASQNSDAVTGLADAVASGQLSQAGFAASVQRVTALRQSL